MAFVEFHCFFFFVKTRLKHKTVQNYQVNFFMHSTLMLCVSKRISRMKSVPGIAAFTMAEAKPNFDVLLEKDLQESFKDDIPCTQFLHLPTLEFVKTGN